MTLRPYVEGEGSAAAAALVASGVSKSWVILWQVIAIVLWTALVTATATGLITALLAV